MWSYINSIVSCSNHKYWPRIHPPNLVMISQIAKFMGPTWGPPGSCRPQMGPMLAPWTLLSGIVPIFPVHCVTTVTWHCRKNFSQWGGSLPLTKFFWQHQIAVVIQGPEWCEENIPMMIIAGFRGTNLPKIAFHFRDMSCESATASLEIGLARRKIPNGKKTQWLSWIVLCWSGRCEDGLGVVEWPSWENKA